MTTTAMFGLRGRRLLGLFAVLAIFLGLVSWQGYNLYETSRQRHTEYNYQPAAKPGFRIGATTKTPTEHYKPSCQNPNNEKDADLCAQWASVEQATETNRLASASLRLSIFSLGFTLIGTALLIWTLHETRRANKLQLRAYLNVTSSKAGKFEPGTRFSAKVTITNKGQTPAHDVVVAAYIARRELPFDVAQFKFAEFDGDMSKVALGAGEPMNAEVELPVDITEAAVAAFKAGKAGYFIYGRITYRDVFGESHTTTYLHDLQRDSMLFSPCQRGNDAD